MRALSKFPPRPFGKITRTTSLSLKKLRITAPTSKDRSTDLLRSVAAAWLRWSGGLSYRSALLAAALVGSTAGSLAAQERDNPLRESPRPSSTEVRPSWSDRRDGGSLQLSAPASVNQSLPTRLVPKSTTSELGGDSAFASNGSRLDWRPRMSAAERVKKQVAERADLFGDEQADARTADPFRDPFGDAKAVRTVADWTEPNALRGKVSPAVDSSANRRGAVVHAGGDAQPKSVLVARNEDDLLPPPAVMEEAFEEGEEVVTQFGAPRNTYAQGAPTPPETTEESGIAPLPPPSDQAGETVEDHLKRCDAAAEFARMDQLSRISLDLTPTFSPALTRADDEKREDPAEALADEPVRSWTNRGGAVVAEGRMVGFENGYVRIDGGSGVQSIRYRDLSESDLYYVGKVWRIPAECVLRDEALLARSWEPTTFTWKASALCHKPLYFEERQLERYGHTAGPILQPVISGAHFFVNIATLPYHMGINPPNECQYVLGYYRPGSCAPWVIEPVPLSLRGALVQAGVVVGGVAILP